MTVVRFKNTVKRLLRRPIIAPPPYTKDVPELAGFDIGVGTYGRPRVHKWENTTRLKIGKYTSIADDVNILLGGEHRTDWVTTYPFNVIDPKFAQLTGNPSSKGDVVIGNDVWIAYGATLLSGITVGDGAVIGAKSLVTRSVEPYSIVAGSPARHVRYRFSPDVIAQLLEVRWWELPQAAIDELVPLLQSPNVDELLAASRKLKSTHGTKDE